MIYLHMKSKNEYQLLHEGKLEATLEEVVIYKSLGTGEIWVRPKKEFNEKFVYLRGYL